MSVDESKLPQELEAEPVGGLDVCSGAGCSKTGLVGDYDWKWLCMPQVSCGKSELLPPPFLAKDDRLPLLVSLIMGLQHCLAMLGGIVTVPALIAGDACFPWQSDEKLCASKEYMISASLFASGILTIVQVVRFRLVKGYFLGTGLLSVMGTSFTFLPIARDIVVSEIRAGNSGFEAYGKFLGTCMVASLLEIAISFMPPKIMRRIFPPVVTGTCVTLIGGALTATGLKYWCALGGLCRAHAQPAREACRYGRAGCPPSVSVHRLQPRLLPPARFCRGRTGAEASSAPRTPSRALPRSAHRSCARATATWCSATARPSTLAWGSP